VLSSSGNRDRFHIHAIDKTERTPQQFGALRLPGPIPSDNPGTPVLHGQSTLFSCYTILMSSTSRLRNVTVTLEEDVAQWARIEAARQDTSVSRMLGEILKERMGVVTGKSSVADAAERLAGFGKRHNLSLGGLTIKDLINEGRR
jgi:hypothetical protein